MLFTLKLYCIFSPNSGNQTTGETYNKIINLDFIQRQTMTNCTISNLYLNIPTLDISTNVDFDKTVSYIFMHSNVNMEVITNNHSSCYQTSELLLRKAQMQYKNKEITWIETMACFEEQHGECLLKDGRDANKAFDAALQIYRWISEESDYLQSVYQQEANLYRQEIYNRMDCLENKRDAYKYVSKHKTEAALAGILYRLRVSSSLRYPNRDIQKILYLLSYDTDIVSKALPLIINTIHELIINELIGKEVTRTLYNILNQKAIAQEKEVAQFWYSDEWSKLHPLITEAIQLQALIFLLLEQTGEEEDMPIIAARICRYLSRFPSAYSELLKNKSYTHLTGENRLNGRIQWNHLCNFDEKLFLEQVIMIRVDEQPCPAYEPENKWIQCSNTTNTLTLDNDGFTLSLLFPHTNHTWKGRKDRAAVLNNRLFLTSFSKLPCAFDSCKNIKDFRLYWKQLAEDYPMSQQWDSQIKKNVSPPKIEIVETRENEILFSTSDNTLPAIDQDLKVQILFVDEENLSIQTEIIDEPFRGMNARLPFAYINSCHAKIIGFASLFTVNEIFRVKVKEINKGEVVLSLIKDFNEFIYPECVRQKNLTGQIVEIREGKVCWLLSSGATATTSIPPHKKYTIGDTYKVEYTGLLSDKLKNNINVQSHLAQPDENEFNQTILDNIRDFFLYLTKDALKVKNNLLDSYALKTKNNPFFVALQNISLKETEDAQIEIETQETPETEYKEKKTALSNPTLNAKLVQELIYCMDSLINNIENPCEQFNTYNILRFLCHFIGNKELANYYSLCADYIYNVDLLTTEPFQDRFSKGNIQKFNQLLARMESLRIERYSTLGLCKQVIQVLQALFDTNSLSLLQSFIQSENQTVSELARYFSITWFLKENDTTLQQLIYKNINLLLGFKEPEKKAKLYIPVYFGHEGVEKEFKTSAFIHADKNAAEDQCVVLARVVASFMNTDGGTLYIGVNDLGYLTGLSQEFKFTHNDSDVYLRTVNRNIIRQLGEADSCNRYQEYIRCRLYEYEDGRMVLAFRVSPINEVVKVKDVVYTRSASSNVIKLEQNVSEFIKKRREQKLNFVPLKPEFPTLFSPERNEYIFNTIPLRPPYPEQAEEQSPVFVPIYSASQKAIKLEKENTRTTFTVGTSSLRNNPLQKKAEYGYTPNHLFVSVFADGKIAYSASPKIGIWGDKKGKVVFSYKPDDKEDLMVAVFNNGEVGISNLKKGMSQPNTPIAFVNAIDSLFFLSPAHKTDYLLLLSEKNAEKRYRIISLQDFEKSMSIQPKNTLILEPDKGTFIFAEILSPAHLRVINDDKTSLFDFDQYNAGRYWEHTVYRQGVDVICKLCALPF